jgi:murein DD-endopeptidase MepM/ murein hydrolase activator NlpD
MPQIKEQQMKRTGTYVMIAIIILLAGAAGWLYFANYLDRGKPTITLSRNIIAIGKQQDIGITFSDDGGGLSCVKVEIIQDNQPRVLAQESIASQGTRQKIIKLTANTENLKLKNGPAVVRITADDFSLFNNETIIDVPVAIDTIPPQISILNPVNYINQGGTGFIAYRISKPATSTGVYVDDQFAPGYTVPMNNGTMSVTYFAVPLDATNDKTRISVFASDEAGNVSKISLPCTIKPKRFRSDSVNLSNNFLQKIVPEFQASVPGLQGKTSEEVFTYINTTLREQNTITIQDVCRKSVNKRLWEGTFVRMSNAAPMALFGDQRTYMFDGKSLGNSVHLGIDLASTIHSPIEAANNGIVVFAGPLGIYGNAVIIDHGMGLLSLYGHLSAIETAVGKTVRKTEKIGLTGSTGLAGGDHLHFSILVNGQFVNPTEWWDPHWIEDNVMKKMTI